jgi:hypothetical protein
MSSNVVRCFAAGAGVSGLLCVIAGPMIQFPTNMPIATAAIVAISGSARKVEVFSRCCGKRMGISGKENARRCAVFHGPRNIIAPL